MPPDLEIHLVLANRWTHKTAMIHDWLAMHLHFRLHLTPTSAWWINRVERWFADLTEHQIRRGTLRSTQELEAATGEHLTVHNGNSNLFVWMNSAAPVLESPKRFRQRICETGHWQLAQGRQGQRFKDGTEIRGRDKCPPPFTNPPTCPSFRGLLSSKVAR